MTIRHTIEAFSEPITALPTDPQLAPEELKRRLQAPSEELRAAHNALAKEVGGIADATYPDTVTREMLTPEVKQEIAAKAEQSALASEAAARESADSALSDAVAHKCELFFGSYTGDGKSTRAIELGFAPKAVFLIRKDGITYDSTRSDGYYGGLATPGMPCVAKYDSSDYREEMFRVTETGFTVHTGRFVSCNYSSVVFYYFAVK